jgi:rhamnulokinase
VASHDTASAVAALPEMDSESVFISSGTWSLMGTEVAEPNTSEDARRLQFTNEGAASGGCLLLKNLAGLWVIQECLRHWEREGQHYEWGNLLQAAASSPPFLSLFDPNDKRFDLQANMPSAIQGYCRDTSQSVPETPGQFARAVFESLALTYRFTLASLETLMMRRLPTIRVVGGGSRNKLLCQMIADACGRRVIAGPAEATSLGNVMAQAIATGYLPSFEVARACMAESCQRDEFEPNPSASWDEAYARFMAFDSMNEDSRSPAKPREKETR